MEGRSRSATKQRCRETEKQMSNEGELQEGKASGKVIFGSGQVRTRRKQQQQQQQQRAEQELGSRFG